MKTIKVKSARLYFNNPPSGAILKDFPGIFGGYLDVSCPVCCSKMLSIFQSDGNPFEIDNCVIVPYCFSCSFSYDYVKYTICGNAASDIRWDSYRDDGDDGFASEWEAVSARYWEFGVNAKFVELDVESEELLKKRLLNRTLTRDDLSILASKHGKFAPAKLGGYPIVDPFAKYSGNFYGVQPLNYDKLKCSCGKLMEHFLTVSNPSMYDLGNEGQLLVLPETLVAVFKCRIHNEYVVFHQA